MKDKNYISVTALPVTLGIALLICGVIRIMVPMAVLPKLAMVGGVVYTITAWIYGQMLEWLSSGSGAKAAPVLGAQGLYLASQCFSGMIL